MSSAYQPMGDLNRALECASEADAFQSLLRAAQGGCLRAQSLVGLAYQMGRGVAANFECAAGWYRKAALAGDVFAIANLGVMTLAGQGMAADDVEAYTWLRSAVGLGQETLRPVVDELERRITAGEQRREIRLMPLIPAVHRCMRPNCDPCRCEAI